MIIPAFKEVYTKQVEGDIVKTVCELVAIGELTEWSSISPVSKTSYHKGEKLSFGISRTSASSKYNKNIGKKLSYAMAMRFLMLKLNDGKINVEDNIK